jgi:hypothetical protein
MTTQLQRSLLLATFVSLTLPLFAQEQPGKMKPEETEVWSPEPKVVTPGANCTDAPSDAIILFDGKNEENGFRRKITLRRNGWYMMAS